MAEQENNNPLGLADVINSVDSASSKELAALSKIEKKLDGHAQPVAGGSASNAPAPRSISRNQARKKEQQRLRREAIKTQANNSDKTGEKRKNITTSGKPAENKQKTNLNTAN
ncbi:hypothetical protein, partial [Chimaeribacter californicus]|uniref:hypothetical protein n=1 Tax=Chimaeribacter californicus TaxID=2060067 RepID=UPI0011AF1A36